MNAHPVHVDQLNGWRAEAEGLDKLAEPGSARRAHAAVIDVAVALALLDEVERLRRALSLQANDGSSPGPIPTATLTRWRAEAESVSVDDERWTYADRLLSAIAEIEARRNGAAATLTESAAPTR